MTGRQDTGTTGGVRPRPCCSSQPIVVNYGLTTTGNPETRLEAGGLRQGTCGNVTSATIQPSAQSEAAAIVSPRPSETLRRESNGGTWGVSATVGSHAFAELGIAALVERTGPSGGAGMRLEGGWPERMAPLAGRTPGGSRTLRRW